MNGRLDDPVATVTGGRRDTGAHAAAQAGVIGLTKSVTRELIGTGNPVNSVAPVMVETDLLQQMTPDPVEASKKKIAMNRLLMIDELAAGVSFAASPEGSLTTGSTFDASGGRATY
jgi:3-oxoacyl-[acyl-carrier protein] reductase